MGLEKLCEFLKLHLTLKVTYNLNNKVAENGIVKIILIFIKRFMKSKGLSLKKRYRFFITSSTKNRRNVFQILLKIVVTLYKTSTVIPTYKQKVNRQRNKRKTDIKN